MTAFLKNPPILHTRVPETEANLKKIRRNNCHQSNTCFYGSVQLTGLCLALTSNDYAAWCSKQPLSSDCTLQGVFCFCFPNDFAGTRSCIRRVLLYYEFSNASAPRKGAHVFFSLLVQMGTAATRHSEVFVVLTLEYCT